MADNYYNDDPRSPIEFGPQGERVKERTVSSISLTVKTPPSTDTKSIKSLHAHTPRPVSGKSLLQVVTENREKIVEEIDWEDKELYELIKEEKDLLFENDKNGLRNFKMRRNKTRGYFFMKFLNDEVKCEIFLRIIEASNYQGLHDEFVKYKRQTTGIEYENYKKEIQNENINHLNTIDSLETKLDELRDELQTERKKSQVLRKGLQEKNDKLVVENNELQVTHEMWSDERKQLRVKYDDCLQSNELLKKKLDVKRRDIQEMEYRHEEEMQGIITNHGKEIENLKDIHRKQIQQMQVLINRPKEMIEMERKHKEEIQCLKEKYEKYINDMKDQHQDEKKDMIEHHQKEIETLKSDHEDQIDRFREEVNARFKFERELQNTKIDNIEKNIKEGMQEDLQEFQNGIQMMIRELIEANKPKNIINNINSDKELPKGLKKAEGKKKKRWYQFWR